MVAGCYSLFGLTKKDIPRIELGLLDSKSNVLTITPYVLANGVYLTVNNYYNSFMNH